MRTFRNILIVRTDRIGDVLLALPMVPAIRMNVPGSRISMLLRSYTKELVDGFGDLESIILFDEAGRARGFWSLLREIRSGGFDLAVVSHPTLRIGLLMFFARIPVRIGTGYRWYSFLFNRRVFEHRRTAEKHEAEYNLSLLEAAGISVKGIPSITLPIPESARAAAAAELKRLGISSGERFVVLHPGSGGSARDWSAERFGDLARHLSMNGRKVVVTGADSEHPLVESVVQVSGHKALSSVGRFTLKELAAFLKEASLFVSNSTGPLHIAAAVGVPVIAFYPPITECSARRWGPLAESKIIFTADSALCPRCKGGPCQGNDCMDQIRVEEVLRAATDLLDSQRDKK